eukprot:c7560_g1_i1.p1 GENE.c7560_g1_i1~~c7560_g1_i1.p1  ORF type:complete len:405 (+),score=66.09 c7560_g1_i1:83-1216(+)
MVLAEAFRILVWLTNEQWFHLLVGPSPAFSFLGVSKARNMGYRIVIGLILLGFFIYGVYDAARNHDIESGFIDLRRWANDQTVATSVVIICWYLFVIPMCLPSFVFSFGTAYIYAGALGFPLGLLYSVITGILGMFGGQFVSFFLARYVVPNWVEKFDIPRVFVPQQLGVVDTMQYIMALRLFPTIPTATLNYSLGLSSSITLPAFCLGTVGNWPGLGFWMFFGAALGAGISHDNGRSNLTAQESSFVWIVGIIFAMVTIGVLVWLMHIEAEGTKPATDDVELGQPVEKVVETADPVYHKHSGVPRLKNLDEDQEIIAMPTKTTFAVKETSADNAHFDTALAAERGNRNPDPRPPATKKIVQGISKRISRDRQSADE